MWSSDKVLNMTADHRWAGFAVLYMCVFCWSQSNSCNALKVVCRDVTTWNMFNVGCRADMGWRISDTSSSPLPDRHSKTTGCALQDATLPPSTQWKARKGTKHGIPGCFLARSQFWKATRLGNKDCHGWMMSLMWIIRTVDRSWQSTGHWQSTIHEYVNFWNSWQCKQPRV